MGTVTGRMAEDSVIRFSSGTFTDDAHWGRLVARPAAMITKRRVDLITDRPLPLPGP